MQRFGEKLHILRKQRGLTLRELAPLLDMKSYSHLAQIEKGNSLPSVGLLVKIADLFDVSLDQLVRDELELD